MKKVFILGSMLLALGATQPLLAQDSTLKEVGKDVKETGRDVGKAAKKGGKKVGHKTAEVASKGKAKITDAVYKDKVGPNGETIYIDNHSRYYWVDDRGRRHYVVESELKNKNDR